MEVLGICILSSTILVLVDRNKKWPTFWKTTAALVLLFVLGIVAIKVSDHYSAQRANAAIESQWEDVAPAKK